MEQLKNCNHQCTCICHTKPGMMHIRACCHKCDKCGQNIKDTMRGQHLRECHDIDLNKK